MPQRCQSPLQAICGLQSQAMLRSLLSYYNVISGLELAVTKAPFTAAARLLSSISLEFHCSGWEAPEAPRQT